METLETLQSLVERPSETGNEAGIAAYVAEQLAHSGLEIEMIDGNVVACLPGVDRARAFILNGHLDTVPVVEGWTTDPYTLTPDLNDQDLFYGLGASDMKSGLALMLEIAKTAPRPLPYDLWLFFTKQEEVDNAGAKVIAEWFTANHQQRYHTVGGLILEPTNAQFIGVGHRNGLKLDVTAHGDGGHGSKEYPAQRTAIGKLGRFIANLESIQAHWKATYSHELLGAPTINPSNIAAGTGKHNIVPSTATAEFDLRSTPELVEALPKLLTTLEQQYDITIVSPWEPVNSVCSPDSYIYQSVQKSIPGMPFKGFPGATDLFPFLENGVPLLTYGPGAIEAMHTPNEYVRASSIKLAHETIQLIMKNY